MGFKSIFKLIGILILIAVPFGLGFIAGGGFGNSAGEEAVRSFMVSEQATDCFPADDWQTLRECLAEITPDRTPIWLRELPELNGR